jgi:nucleotide-binding universal stress UspA family protein
MTLARRIVVGIDPARVDSEPLALATQLGDLLDASVVKVTVTGDSPARGLHEAAMANHAAMLVIGPSHSGLLGSVADRVLHGSTCAVALAPHGYHAPESGLRRIGVAFVDTPEGRAALRHAAGLAARAGGRLQVITVVEWFDPTGMLAPPAELVEHERRQTVELAEMAAQRALEPISAGLTPLVVVLAGGTTDELVDRTRTLDLLVSGSRSYGPLRSVLLGSVSRALAHHAHCPLVVIPRSTDEVGGLDEVLREREGEGLHLERHPR